MSVSHLRQFRPLRAGRSVALLLGLALGAGAADGPLRAPALVVEDLLGADWKARQAAKAEALRLGARVLPRLIEARAAMPAAQEPREALDEVLRAVVQALAAEVVRPLADPAERAAADTALGGPLAAWDRERPDEAVTELGVGDLRDEGSLDAAEPLEWSARRSRARRARGALLLCGPAASGPLLQAPPVRERPELLALAQVANRLWARERGLALQAKDPPARAAFLARYRGLLDLCAPVLGAGLADPDPLVRGLYQSLRDQALSEALPALDASDPQARRWAEEQLFRLGPLARPALQRLAEQAAPTPPGEGSSAGGGRSRALAVASPQARDAAARLAHRIRYAISPELVRRLGDDLPGYAGLPFRVRRERLLELERLGGAEAVPTLRALLDEEASDELRTLAAVALFRLGDPWGPEWLSRHGASVDVVRLSRRELAAIFMDQGLRNLGLGRYERAEHELKAVLELEPQNETAWYNLACTYARWGKLDQAIEHLRRAVELGFDDAGHMEQDPDLESLRQDPRYRELIARLRARGSGE